jgi:hypothetical protein
MLTSGYKRYLCPSPNQLNMVISISSNKVRFTLISRPQPPSIYHISYDDWVRNPFPIFLPPRAKIKAFKLVAATSNSKWAFCPSSHMLLLKLQTGSDHVFHYHYYHLLKMDLR